MSASYINMKGGKVREICWKLDQFLSHTLRIVKLSEGDSSQPWPSKANFTERLSPDQDRLAMMRIHT